MPQRRIMVSARFLKPIRDPCPIFVVANGDLLNPAIRLLIQQRMQCPLEKILEMITERLGLRILGGSAQVLYTFEGQQVTEGSQLESGQFYVAVGRERVISGGGDSKVSPPAPSSEPNKNHMSSIVREISQARLRSVRRRKSGLSMSLNVANNDGHLPKCSIRGI
ncbi:hypothetical protein CRUP_030798 [Coryphaenoides rupestris]|nr:hypothetical protein CRUP_030798 [Coryphaenoides rupestris]